MMFFDDPGILYENPPPPRDYEFDFDADPVFFTYPRPQRIIGVNFLKIDHSLIHKELTRYEEIEDDSTNTTKEDASTSNFPNNENLRCVTTGELNTEVSVNEEASEDQIDKSKNSKVKDAENVVLKKVIKCEFFKENESTIVAVDKKQSKQNDQIENEKDIHADFDKLIINKTKNVQYSKTSALESISKSYSGKSFSNSDSENENGQPKKPKLSSHRTNSLSKKPSKHKRKDKGHRKHSSHSDTISNDKVVFKSAELSVKQEILSSDSDSSSSKKTEIKEEVVSDEDDNNGDKIESSKISRKKRRRDSRDRLDNKRSKDNYRYDSRRKRHNRSSSDDDDRSRYSEDSQERSYWKREIKTESEYYRPIDLYCDVCKIILNSEATYSSHMAGKKHKKALRLKNEEDVAKSQILDIEERTNKPAVRYSNHPDWACSDDTKELQSYPKASDMERIKLHDVESKIQQICEDNSLTILGLDYVQEIRGYEETKYFCELCGAQCVANSIIRHLIGFKHQLSCVKVYCPRTYNWIRELDRRDKRVDKEISYELNEAMFKFGRGKIQVYKDKKKHQNFPDPYQPSTSREYPEELIKKSEELTGPTVTDEDCVSRRFSDFYCVVCDAHMNNHAMWESHARGKRHLKNKKKAPEGLVSDSNYIEAPRGTISNLEVILENPKTPRPIVGLNFIKENQGVNGSVYNCFLCGSVCTSMDILDHLTIRKHKVKYLEKMHSNGYINAINQISTMPVSDSPMGSLVDEECWKLLKQVGIGKPVIAIAKKVSKL